MLVRTGYTFTDWNTEGDGTGDDYVASGTYSANATATLYAQWTQNTYTVTATAGANGTIDPASRSVLHGSTTTFTVTPATNYNATVTGCSGTLAGTTYTTGAITNDCTVSASFTRSSSGGGGGGGGSSSSHKKETPAATNVATTVASTTTKTTAQQSHQTAGVSSANNDLLTLIELLVSFGIIPAEKATLARTFVAEKIGTPTKPTLPSTFRFTTPLKQGDTHPEVQLLQQFLNARGFTVAQTGAGSAGQETDYFGPATRAAVIRFQEAYRADILTPIGLTVPTGEFHRMSMQKANELLAESR